jgi:hypothetical protein
MKKISGLLVLVVSLGLFVQSSLGMDSASSQVVVKPLVTTSDTDLTGIGTLLGISGVITGVKKGIEYVGGPTAVLTYAGIAASMLVAYKVISNKVAANKDANKKLLQAAVDYTSNRETLMLSKFPETIKEKIDALLDQKLEGDGKSISLFPTPQSKIFVLQNIEDFFVLRKQSESYRNLSQFVHTTCMEKINAILLAEKDIDEEAKKINQAIDNERKRYMNQYGISVATLKDIASEDLQAKIEDVQKGINFLVLDAVNNNKTLDKEKNIQFSALISILAHLFYKQSENKTPMFEGAERISKLKQTRVGKKDLEYNPEDFTKEAQQRAAEENREALARQYVGMKFLSEQEGIQKREEEIAQYKQSAQQQPVQQSYWSRLTSAVKSWFGW